MHGTRVEEEVAKTRLGSRDALLWLQERLEAMGVMRALRAQGAQEGDTVHIGEVEMEYVP